MPLISCILPTRDRQQFLPHAIRYHQRQSISSQAELIIVDDSTESCRQLVPPSGDIHYIRLNERTALGEKLNIGIAHSSGRIIQKLDDDDYYSPSFLERTSDALLASDPEHNIVASDTFLVLVAGYQHLFHAGYGWFTGASFCFPRVLWERAPFRNAPSRVDVLFLEDHPSATRIVVSDPELLVVVRHGNNTWTHMKPKPERKLSVPIIGETGENVTDYFQRCPIYYKSLADVVGAENFPFYVSLQTS